LVDGVGGGAVVGDFEFGDLLLAGVAGRIGGYVRGSTLGVHVLMSGGRHMEAVEGLDDFVGVDLSSVRIVLRS
jgi:hypothetical protein